MQAYNHNEIEKKWQKKWEEDGLNKTQEKGDKKFYILDMFPYPSGEGLHVGHPKGYIATDVYSRLKRMQGYDVLHPMGFDAFGLPAEQYALKNKVNPNISTAKNVARYKEQLQMLGLNYDWDREVNTTDPKFYKWTQWMWKQMYKKGLAYESYDPINWCPSCKTGLANEDLENGLCERCGSVVEKKPLRQWTIRITDYADRLLADIDKLDWEPHIKELQRNWIGKSEGSEIDFPLVNFPYQEKLTVFTTRADTMYGATFMAISYELAEKWIDKGWSASTEIKQMIEEIKTDVKKQDFSFKDVPEKKGIATGVMAKNPVNGELIPVYIANYILSGYGTGAIMAVPAHDERDGEFARKYSIKTKVVVGPFIQLTGDDAEREGFPTVVRKIVDPILLDNENNIYLVKDVVSGQIHLPGGGVDEGEKEEEALLREIKEETGFTDLQIEKKLPLITSCWGFRHPKQRNQRSIGPAFVVRLNSLDRIPSEVEQGDLELVKVPLRDAIDVISWQHHKDIVSFYLEQRNEFTEEGVLLNSESFDGISSKDARVKITEKVGGKITSTYKLKDWVFARQRYWGEPFPIVFDENHISYAVADSELPVALPMVDEYEPTGTGESPLANIKDWVEVYGYINEEGEFESLPKDDPKAKLFRRETNTMPQWAGSSWYYLRYIDPHNDEVFADKDKEKKWSPVDFYVGGAEHATRHLIYARFWHKFLFDIGVVSYDEPFTKLQTVGLIMAEDGRKMSKRWGNVVNPDDVVKEYGADTLRLYEMFMGPFDQSVAWSTSSMAGVNRFLERFWKLRDKITEEVELSSDVQMEVHKTIKKVGDDIEQFKFNTAISQMMILLNVLEKEEGISRVIYKTFTQLLAPFAPHLTEEIWLCLGNEESIHRSSWPTYDETKLYSDTVTVAVQIGGKMRGTIEIQRDFDDSLVIQEVKVTEIYKKYVGEVEPKKIIIVKNKIVNIVI
jgi:leucyl-tRNA synthetase